MRKEILFAILAGATLGLIIAFGIWRANVALKSDDAKVTSEQTPTPQTEFGITIASPDESQVITSTPTTISGITKPEAYVVISAEDEDYIVKADEKGEFSQDIDLVGGVNQIVVTSFDQEGNKIEKILTLVFSTQFAEAQ